MAQVYQGSFVTNASEGRSLTFNWAVNKTNVAENFKEIYWSLVGSGNASGYVRAGDFKVVIDGETVYNSATRINLYNGTVVASGYKKIYHDTYGNKKFSASVQASIYEYAVDNTGSGTWELQTIPRYATSNQSLNSKTETSITMNFSSDSTIDYVWYSTDGGTTWVGIWSGSATSGTYTISLQSKGSNLSANTTYNIVTRVRRKDSQLTTDSSKLSVTTYDYPHCIATPNFTIGEDVTFTLYNPLKRSIRLNILNGSGTRIVTGYGTSGTEVKSVATDVVKNALYNSIPNRQSGKYQIEVIYGDYTNICNSGALYRIKGTEVPTINGFDYIDNNADIVAITGNNQHIVQNKSKLLARFHSATPNYGAGSIAQYYLECNGKTANGSKEGTYELGTIDSANNVDLTLTAVDSRGLSSSKTIKVTMLEHSTPNAIVTLQRLNNYEDETYLTVDGSISSVNGKNTMTIQYRYKVSSGSYGSFTVIGDREKQTLSLNKNNEYIFEVFVTDRFGSQFVKEYVLRKGMFPLFIDTVKNSVGINCFPAEEKSLEVNGFNLFNVYKCCKNILLSGNDGLKITVNNFANSDKIPIIVAGADNSSMTPVFTVIHLRSGSGFGHISLGLDSTVTRNGKDLHIKASQWSYFTVFAPLGADITLSNSAL